MRRLRADGGGLRTAARAVPPVQPPAVPPMWWPSRNVPSFPCAWGGPPAVPRVVPDTVQSAVPMDRGRDRSLGGAAPRSTAVSLSGRRRNDGGGGGGQSQGPPRRVGSADGGCGFCSAQGHFYRSCPKRRGKQPGGGEAGGSTAAIGAAATGAGTQTGRGRVSVVTVSGFGAETCLDVCCNGVSLPCLLDTGCDHSVIPHSSILL